MKILHVLEFFSPSCGGTVNALYGLTQALVKRGHIITIYTTSYKKDQAYADSLLGINVHIFHNWFKLFGMYFTLGMILEARHLRFYDAIHLHSARSFQNIVIHHYAKKYGIPYILQAHGSYGTFFQKGLLKMAYDIVWGDRILRDAKMIIAVTEIEARQYEDQSKIRIIPIGINISEFDNLPAKGEFRRKYGL